MCSAQVRLAWAFKTAGDNPCGVCCAPRSSDAACFVLVATGANRRTDLAQNIARDKASGTGGFALIAETDVPVYHDFHSKDGQFELGFSQAEAERLDWTRIIPLRVLPGEDASCLNLYRPESPRILGVPESLIQRGGFAFQQTLDEMENPWGRVVSRLGRRGDSGYRRLQFRHVDFAQTIGR